MGGGMNCGYACSMIGFLKIVTVVLTGLPAALMFMAIGRAEFYKNENKEEGCKKVSDKINLILSTGKSDHKLKPCPETSLGYTALTIFAFCFVISLVCLIILLLVKLNENGCFKQLDYIYHLAAGAVLVVGGILAITFAALALNWFPSCEDSALKDKCEDYRKTAFEPEFQLAAGAFGILAGILYIYVCCKVKNS